jgi:hypothetical protein
MRNWPFNCRKCLLLPFPSPRRRVKITPAMAFDSELVSKTPSFCIKSIPLYRFLYRFYRPCTGYSGLKKYIKFSHSFRVPTRVGRLPVRKHSPRAAFQPSPWPIQIRTSKSKIPERSSAKLQLFAVNCSYFYPHDTQCSIPDAGCTLRRGVRLARAETPPTQFGASRGEP